MLPKFFTGYKFYLTAAFLLTVLFFPYDTWAGTTPPVTTHTYSGSLGNNGWYTSTVEVTLRVSDLESGPKSTTYWVDSNDPTTIDFSSSQNQILNPSFEDSSRHGLWPLYWYSVRHWDDNDCEPCNAFFWQSTTEAKFDYRSAALAIIGSGQYYYHNRNRSVSIVPGEDYTVSVWVKTLDITGVPGAWLEAWAKDSGDEMENDYKVGETTKLTGTNDWTLLSYSFTAPSGYSQLYLRLVVEDSGYMGIAWFDGVSMYGGTDFFTDFLIVNNGEHNLYYYSTDNNDNVETVKEATLNIDTVGPQDWRNFTYDAGTNDHTFSGSVEVRDVTSGLDVSETYYAYYTNHQDEEWDHNGDGETDWYPMQSIALVPSGSPAYDGVTSYVEITTPQVDFGNSATVMRFQFQATDMAGNIFNSQVLTIAGAWVKTEGKGDIYIRGNIYSAPAPVEEGEYNCDGVLASQSLFIQMFPTSTYYTVENYDEAHTGEISGLFPDYQKVRDLAIPLPGGKLPVADGIYYYTGNYIIDQNSVPSGFEGGEITAVVIIEGEMTIKKGYDLNNNSNIVFLVTGDIKIEGNVSEVSGFFFTNGNFYSNIDSQGNKQLVLNGGISAWGDLILGRNLGRKGSPNNNYDPSEYIIFDPMYFFDSALGNYLGGAQVKMTWDEI